MAGMISRVVAFARQVVEGAHAPEVRVDSGSGAATTPYHFSSPGDDSQPLPGDAVHVSSAGGTGLGSALGYQDPESEPRAEAGEKRIYSRSGPGEVACEIWLKADGTVVVESGSTAIVVDGSGVRLGSSSAAQFVALGDLVTVQLQTLKAAIAAAPVTAGDGGAAFKASIVSALSLWPLNVSAGKVRAE